MIRLDADAPGFEAAFARLLAARETPASVGEAVAAILARVRADGDDAVAEYARRFDGQAPHTLGADEIAAGEATADPEDRAALAFAAARIEAFHRLQLPEDIRRTDAAGITLGLRWTPLDAVGVYVPGGRAAYPSTVLMNAIPARVAGVGRIAMCSPAPDGALPPLVLAAARLAGVTEIHRVGGAQAIAALAYGTDAIAAVDRIVGPGNAWVAEAKRQVFGRVGIDSVAGPSEVVVLADARNDPRHVALDLLAQAEHDEAAQSVLITDDPGFADAVARAVAEALRTLPRRAIAGASWERNGAIVLCRDWTRAAALVDLLAPEHLQIMVDAPEALFARIRHAGAAFLGRFCPEAVGDYVAGPNHVLPTGGTARFSSGLSVHDFLKRTTWVACDAAGLGAVGPAAMRLAGAEGLDAHRASIAARLEAVPTGAA